MRKLFTAAAIVALTSAGLGCSAGLGANSSDAAPSEASFFSCDTETRAIPYSPGLERTSTSGAYTAKLMISDPAPPAKGTDVWTVMVVDASAAQVDGLTMTAVPFMPDHNHGTSVKAAVTGTGGGVYLVTPLYFFMAGYWEITLSFASDGGAAADSVMFPICIPD
jgi:hypothetical protein